MRWFATRFAGEMANEAGEVVDIEILGKDASRKRQVDFKIFHNSLIYFKDYDFIDASINY